MRICTCLSPIIKLGIKISMSKATPTEAAAIRGFVCPCGMRVPMVQRVVDDELSADQSLHYL